MGHIEKHINKSLDELADRMMTEWKLNVGSLYYDVTNIIEKHINENQECYGRHVGFLLFNNPIGIFIDRNFDIYESSAVRYIVEGDGKNCELITVYPSETQAIKIGHYDISQNHKFLDSGFVPLFKELNDIGYQPRIVLFPDKPSRNHIKICFDNGYNVKINKTGVILEYINPNNKKDIQKIDIKTNILDIVRAISTYKEHNTILGKSDINDWIQEQGIEHNM